MVTLVLGTSLFFFPQASGKGRLTFLLNSPSEVSKFL